MDTDDKNGEPVSKLSDAIEALTQNLFRKETAEERILRAGAAAVMVGLMRRTGESTLFTIDSTLAQFVTWLKLKAWKSWHLPTADGHYIMTLHYVPSPEWIDEASIVNVVLTAPHEPPIETRPLGIIAFTIVTLSSSRLEVTATFNVPEVASVFHELIQLIGTVYPESRLASSGANQGGRPKGHGPTSEQLQLIKRVGDLRAQGLSIGQIATRVGRSPSRIAQICRENNLKKGM